MLLQVTVICEFQIQEIQLEIYMCYQILPNSRTLHNVLYYEKVTALLLTVVLPASCEHAWIWLATTVPCWMTLHFGLAIIEVVQLTCRMTCIFFVCVPCVGAPGLAIFHTVSVVLNAAKVYVYLFFIWDDRTAAGYLTSEKYYFQVLYNKTIIVVHCVLSCGKLFQSQ